MVQFKVYFYSANSTSILLSVQCRVYYYSADCTVTLQSVPVQVRVYWYNTTGLDIMGNALLEPSLEHQTVILASRASSLELSKQCLSIPGLATRVYCVQYFFPSYIFKPSVSFKII